MFWGKRIVLIAISLATLTVVACKNSSNLNTQLQATCTTTSVGCVNQSALGFSGGASTTLFVVSPTALSQYAGAWVTPTSAVTLNINTHPVNNNYLGEANIQYYVGTTSHSGHFTNGTSTNHGNSVNILTVDSATGVPTYRLFFEDPAGVIIVTIQGGAVGTDTGFGTFNGNVYFRNFNSPAPNPLYQSYIDPYTGQYFQSRDYNFCWSGLITTGPYDCRNMSVQPSTTDNHPVTLLGTFTGLDAKTALGL